MTNSFLPDKPSDYTHKNKPSSDNRKFRLVVYGINECPKGTPRHSRFLQDVKSAGEVLSSVDNSVTVQSVRDCFRLGKYSPDWNCPLMVHLNRSCDVVVILSNRRKLASSPAIRIKPALSPSEKKAEKILLNERRRLIDAGIDHKQIKLRKDRILVDNTLHASIRDSQLEINNPTASSVINQSSSVTSPTLHSLHKDKFDTNGSRSNMSETPDAHCPSLATRSPPSVAQSQSDNAIKRK